MVERDAIGNHLYLINGVKCRLVWLACVTCSIEHKATARRGARTPNNYRCMQESHLVTPLGEGFPASPSQGTDLNPIGLWPAHDDTHPTSSGDIERLIIEYWTHRANGVQVAHDDDWVGTLAINHGITVGRLGRRQGSHECYHIQLGTGKLPVSMQQVSGYVDDDRPATDALPFWRER